MILTFKKRKGDCATYRSIKWFCIALFSFVAFLVLPAANASAGTTPNPYTVTIAGSFQGALGLPGDWQPGAVETQLTYDSNDDAWQGTFTIPAGSWEYKVALNNGWDENYGQYAALNGQNIQLNLPAETTVKFYYDHKTHWVTDNVNSIIATVPGNFQSKIGSAQDWDPACLRSWLQDPDGDSIYNFTANLPAGSYEAKAAIGENWDVNYGQGGIQNGPNIPFTVPEAGPAIFAYTPVSHILTVTPPASEWYEDWDAYPAGQSMHGVNGWKGFDNQPSCTAFTSSIQSLSPPNSISLQSDTNLIHEFSGYNHSVWRFTAWQFIPNTFHGSTNFILFNQYADNGSCNLSTKVIFDGSANRVIDFYSSASLPLIRGQWVEIRVEIDLETALQKFFYGDDLLYVSTWERDSNSIPNIGAVNLCYGSSKAIFYDNLSLAQIPPELNIGWGKLIWPSSITAEAGESTGIIYGQVWVDGITSRPGATEGLIAELGYGPAGSDPSGSGWAWKEAVFNNDVGNNDEYKASLTVNCPGLYNYCFRYSDYRGIPVYADLNGPSTAGSPLVNPGILTVTPTSDSTIPSITVPEDMTVKATGPNGAIVTFEAEAEDEAGPVTIIYSKDPGTMFPIGCTTVTCTAVDRGGNSSSASFTVTVLPIEVRIDIMPGDAVNRIRLKGDGIVPVAVLGSAAFDVSRIDPGTVVFAGAPSFHQSKLVDVNLDGFLDLVFQFRTRKITLSPGDTEAIIGGLTSDGFYFTGSDTVQVN